MAEVEVLEIRSSDDDHHVYRIEASTVLVEDGHAYLSHEDKTVAIFARGTWNSVVKVDA